MSRNVIILKNVHAVTNNNMLELLHYQTMRTF